jgi:uncharacterized protein
MRPSIEKKATFRFYEELNDFLPSGERKKDRIYFFKGTPSVKDAIEAQNVPHTEVDLILVNGYPVKFTHKLVDGDQVSVYPVFESFDISTLNPGLGKPLRDTTFILDVHLGKLARLLRMTGFDTYYRNDLDDGEIILKSTSENRIILTRDLGILKNSRVTRGYFVRSQNPREQLKEIINRFQLNSSIKFFSRCMECNGKITEISKEGIENDLKPGTKNYYKKFFRCTQCGKIYWEGSHFERMQDLYGDLQ